nr:VanZ family protein [Shewanella gaetbuli]
MFSSVIAVSFLSFILWIIYLANTGGQSVFFELIKHLPYGDKIGHFLLFGTLTYLANIALKFKTINCGTQSFYWGTITVSLFVLIEEGSQAFIATRTFDLADLWADAAGISFFSFLTWLTQRYYFRPSGKEDS